MSNNILSPLMILQIIQNTDSELKIKYVKNYLMKEIQKLESSISESKDEIETNIKSIASFKEEHRKLVSTPKLFETSQCSK